MDLSWRFESALVLAWALNLINVLPELDATEQEQVHDEFMSALPQLGEETLYFLGNLKYRDLEEIFEENTVNELATTYFRDLLFSQHPDTTKINRAASFERHTS